LNDTERTVVGTFQSLSDAYTNAVLDRINKEQFYREIRDMDVDSIPLTVSNSLLINLRADYINLKNEYQTKSLHLRPNNPDMKNLQGE